MTADAKVGLLLGLFFIVIIAFLVNGLPAYIQEKDTSPTEVSIVTTPGQDVVLDNNLHETAHRLYPPRNPVAQRVVEPPQETVVLDSSQEQIPQVEVPEPMPHTQETVIVQNTPSIPDQQTVKTAKVRTHIVKSGQSLPVIAKQYYGSEEGNRRIVIRKLFEANDSVLKSPDRVCVGDSLVIPPLDTLLGSASTVEAPQSSTALKKTLSDLFKPVSKKEARSISEYTVQEGDSLWSIAEENLGNGNRYKEIAKMNKGRIKNENEVSVGTRLVIPPQ